MEIQSNLVSGSVWSRTKKNGDVSQVTVLLVTNVGCSDKVLAQHPNQVVFVTEQQQVLSMTPEHFLTGRVYEGLDNDVAAAVSYAITGPNEEDEEDIDLDSIEVDNDSFKELEAMASSDSYSGTEDDDASEDDSNTLVEEDYDTSSELQFTSDNPTANALSLVSYSESPFHTGDTLHTLKFSLSGTSLKDVAAVFSSPSMKEFTVTTNTTKVNVVIDGYVATFLEASYEDIACVFLTSVGDFRADLIQPFEQPTEVEEVAQVSEQPNTVTIDVS